MHSNFRRKMKNFLHPLTPPLPAASSLPRRRSCPEVSAPLLHPAPLRQRLPASSRRRTEESTHHILPPSWLPPSPPPSDALIIQKEKRTSNHAYTLHSFPCWLSPPTPRRPASRKTNRPPRHRPKSPPPLFIYI